MKRRSFLEDCTNNLEENYLDRERGSLEIRLSLGGGAVEFVKPDRSGLLGRYDDSEVSCSSLIAQQRMKGAAVR